MGRDLFLASPGALTAGAVFTALLAVVGRSDVMCRKIPNRLVGMLVVAGLAAAVTVFREPVGLTGAVAGFALASVMWLPFWLLGMVGAGDVKLAAAIGVWLGPTGVVEASGLAAIAGGVIAVGVLARRGRLGPFGLSIALWVGAVRRGELTKPLASNTTDVLPYGVAITAGALLAGWLPAAWLQL
jgi:prepilin peptidase CpaA